MALVEAEVLISGYGVMNVSNGALFTPADHLLILNRARSLTTLISIKLLSSSLHNHLRLQLHLPPSLLRQHLAHVRIQTTTVVMMMMIMVATFAPLALSPIPCRCKLQSANRLITSSTRPLQVITIDPMSNAHFHNNLTGLLFIRPQLSTLPCMMLIPLALPPPPKALFPTN